MPIFISANAFLGGTAEKPVPTMAFGLVLAFGFLCLVAAAACAAYGIFRMGSILFPGSNRFLYAVGVLIPAPLIGLLVMFVANSQATGYLKARGVKVGFFGAKR